jgi:hypothetical protein
VRIAVWSRSRQLARRIHDAHRLPFSLPAAGTLMPSNNPETRPDVGFRINPAVAAD